MRTVLRDEGFQGNEKEYYDPRNSFLNEVVERKLGIPISLSLLTIEVARRLGLDLQGVGFPGHFLVKCPEQTGLAGEVFIDAFNGWELLGSDECTARFRAVLHGRPFDQSLPRPGRLAPHPHAPAPQPEAHLRGARRRRAHALGGRPAAA